MHNSEVVEKVIGLLDMGNISEAVDLVLNRRRTKPMELSILVLELTQELIAKNSYRSLRQFKEKLDWYNKHNIKSN